MEEFHVFISLPHVPHFGTLGPFDLFLRHKFSQVILSLQFSNAFYSNEGCRFCFNV